MPRPDHPRRVRICRLAVRLVDLLMIAPVARRRYLVGPLPPTGPLLVAPNHISCLGTVAVGAALTRAGRIPRFVVMGERPFAMAILRFFDHIPRDGSAEAVREALRHGECVVLCPDLPLPTVGALAAELGVPVVPVAQWGAQHVLGPGWLAWRRFPPRRAKLVVTSLPMVPPPTEADELATRRYTDELMDVVTATVLRLREVLEPSVSAPAPPARRARRRRRGDARS